MKLGDVGTQQRALCMPQMARRQAVSSRPGRPLQPARRRPRRACPSYAADAPEASTSAEEAEPSTQLTLGREAYRSFPMEHCEFLVAQTADGALILSDTFVVDLQTGASTRATAVGDLPSTPCHFQATPWIAENEGNIFEDRPEQFWVTKYYLVPILQPYLPPELRPTLAGEDEAAALRAMKVLAERIAEIEEQAYQPGRVVPDEPVDEAADGETEEERRLRLVGIARVQQMREEALRINAHIQAAQEDSNRMRMDVAAAVRELSLAALESLGVDTLEALSLLPPGTTSLTAEVLTNMKALCDNEDYRLDLEQVFLLDNEARSVERLEVKRVAPADTPPDKLTLRLRERLVVLDVVESSPSAEDIVQATMQGGTAQSELEHAAEVAAAAAASSDPSDPSAGAGAGGGAYSEFAKGGGVFDADVDADYDPTESDILYDEDTLQDFLVEVDDDMEIEVDEFDDGGGGGDEEM